MSNIQNKETEGVGRQVATLEMSPPREPCYQIRIDGRLIGVTSDKALAERVTNAINSHDALVEALKFARGTLAENHGVKYPIIAAALKLAGEG